MKKKIQQLPASSTTGTSYIPCEKDINKYIYNRPKKMTVEEMVMNAIYTLDKRKGTSLKLIRKFLLGHYLYDVTIKSKYINKFLWDAQLSGKLIKIKGVGISACYRLPPSYKRRMKMARQKTMGKKEILSQCYYVEIWRA